MYPRFIKNRIQEALLDTRVVLITGPRQSGKTTLARDIAGQSRPFLTLDDASTFEAASSDPVGFVRGLDRAVIDEIQRVPELILAIKSSIDTHTSPGRFLLTGSADLMTLPRVADSLAGRMESIRLLPLAQGEIEGKPSKFLKKVFVGQVPDAKNILLGQDIVQKVFEGGYPEALTRKTLRRRQDWYLNYIEAIIQRDVKDVAQIKQIHLLDKLLRILAEYSGQLFNYSKLGSLLGMNHVTAQRYINIFESLFLVYSLPPWYSNAIKRQTKTPKIHFFDSGLLAALRNISPSSLENNRSLFGSILETFIFGEILKIISWNEERYKISHFRDKDHNEVDFVIENRKGDMVGIEVKASSTVSKADFRGLEYLSRTCGKRFQLGLVLCDHDKVLPFGKKMLAAPLSVLWH